MRRIDPFVYNGTTDCVSRRRISCPCSQHSKVSYSWLLCVFINVGSAIVFSSCSDHQPDKVSPPFRPDPMIQTHEILYEASEPSGMVGHRHIFAVWNLEDSRETIQASTSDSQVWRGIYWLKGDSTRLTNALQFFKAYDNYSNIEPDISQMLSDSDVRYAYANLNKIDGDIVAEAIWICSPKLMKLAYLQGN
jgi:hypothetical protein